MSGFDRPDFAINELPESNERLREGLPLFSLPTGKGCTQGDVDCQRQEDIQSYKAQGGPSLTDVAGTIAYLKEHPSQTPAYEAAITSYEGLDGAKNYEKGSDLYSKVKADGGLLNYDLMQKLDKIK